MEQTFERFFALGMKINKAKLLPAPDGIVLNLGSGDSPIPYAVNLDRPEWYAPLLADYKHESVAAVHAHHFLEHLDSDEVYKMIEEIERVLVPYGVCYITVPYAGSMLAYSTVDHKTYWTDESIVRILNNVGFVHVKDSWDLHLYWQFIAGVKGHNLAVMAQLVKVPSHG